jgi:hypothetical protein
MGEEAAVMGAREWRAFWASRGAAELREVLRGVWPPAAVAPPEAFETHAFRVASLLGSRAPTNALAEELGRIRHDELGLAADPTEDADAARKIADWFTTATAART